MNAYELSISISLIASAVATKLSDENLALTAAIFTQLGDTLATIAVQRSIEKNNQNQESKEKNSFVKNYFFV